MCQKSSGPKYESEPRTGVDIAKVHSNTCLGYWSLTTSSPLLKAAPMPRTTYGSLAGLSYGFKGTQTVIVQGVEVFRSRRHPVAGH